MALIRDTLMFSETMRVDHSVCGVFQDKPVRKIWNPGNPCAAVEVLIDKGQNSSAAFVFPYDQTIADHLKELKNLQSRTEKTLFYEAKDFETHADEICDILDELGAKGIRVSAEGQDIPIVVDAYNQLDKVIKRMEEQLSVSLAEVQLPESPYKLLFKPSRPQRMPGNGATVFSTFVEEIVQGLSNKSKPSSASAVSQVPWQDQLEALGSEGCRVLFLHMPVAPSGRCLLQTLVEEGKLDVQSIQFSIVLNHLGEDQFNKVKELIPSTTAVIDRVRSAQELLEIQVPRLR